MQHIILLSSPSMSHIAGPITQMLQADKKLRREGYRYRHMEFTIKRFPNGEVLPEIPDTLRSAKIYLFHCPQLPNPNTGLMEVILTIDAIERAWGNEVTLVLPFIPYFRQDRRDQGKDGITRRVPISAKVVADMLMMNPIVRGLITFDLHFEQAPGLFKRATDNLAGRMIFFEYLNRVFKGDFSNVVVSSTDLGGGKKAQRMRHVLGAAWLGTILKDRKENSKVDNQGYIGDDVKGRDVLLVDDLGDTLNSVITAYHTFMGLGARSVRVILTHGLLSIDKDGVPAEEKLAKLGIKVDILDTVPRSKAYLENHKDWLTIIPTKRYLAMVIRESHRAGGSVSSLG